MEEINIKLAFFDIDGTLTNSKCKITRNTIKTIKEMKELGIRTSLCTGRSNEYLLKHFKRFKIFDYFISSNGARIYDIKNKKDIFINTISYENLNKVFDYCNNNKLSLTITSDNYAYINKYTNISKNDIHFKRFKNINIIKNFNLYQFIIVGHNLNCMINTEKFINKINELKLINYSRKYLYKIEDNYYYFDVVNKEINKGLGVKKLLDYLNIDKKNTICFGDGINDIEMFKETNINVATGNAIEEIKNIADYVTLSNNDDGIAYFINKYILKK